MSGANSHSMKVASDDDLGAYRSLSTFAVLSLILGFLSLLSFAPTNIFLWVIPPAAIVTGLIALRQITSAPEVWTGIRLAQLGIGLAVVCAGGGVGDKYYHSVRMARHGKATADRFMDKLKRGDIEAAFWLMMPRESRRDLENKSSDDIPTTIMERYGSFRIEVESFADALASGQATAEFESVEETAQDHGTEYASVVYKIHSPMGDNRVLIVATSMPSPETNEPTWFIREQKIGYVPRSYVPPVASGHGHSH